MNWQPFCILRSAMSQISQKKPGQFAPLNGRKADQTVGQTYGERRDRTTQTAEGSSQGVLQRIKDRFTGGVKKGGPAEAFAHSGDRYEAVGKKHDILKQKSRMESGRSLTARVVQPGADNYVGFLNSVIHFFDKKNPRKV